MARNFRELARATMSPEAQARAHERARQMLAELPLQELRRAQELSQVRLAELLETTQPEVSQIEQRTDLYLSTLRHYIEAMGGTLDVIARLPDGDVRISTFSSVGTGARE